MEKVNLLVKIDQKSRHGCVKSEHVLCTSQAKEGRDIEPLSVSLIHICSLGLEFDTNLKWPDVFKFFGTNLGVYALYLGAYDQYLGVYAIGRQFCGPLSEL